MSEAKFKLGDRVEVVGYGSLMWENKHYHPTSSTSFPVIGENEDFRFLDPLSGIVGKTGVVVERSVNDDRWSYSLKGIPEKRSWYYEDQLKPKDDGNHHNKEG